MGGKIKLIKKELLNGTYIHNGIIPATNTAPSPSLTVLV